MTRCLESPKLVTAGALSLLGVFTLTATSRAFEDQAGAGSGMPFQFQAGQPASADEVNQNFAALVTLVEDMQVQIDFLQSKLVELEDRARFLSVSDEEIDGLAGPHLIIEGVNVHIRSGSGSTDDGGAPTGLGNLVVGYNEVVTTEGIGERSGSHNLVLGRGNAFSSTAGIVAGEQNTITSPFASVLAGNNNEASGAFSCVSGGSFNQASGEESSVSGGVSNFATAQRSSASGGAQNTVSGVAASISGGSGGAAGGFASSISGGQSGIASGDQSSITGGQSNSAFGDKATVSGGFNQNENGDFQWRACGLTCE